jgi:hypothetical protein
MIFRLLLHPNLGRTCSMRIAICTLLAASVLMLGACEKDKPAPDAKASKTKEKAPQTKTSAPSKDSKKPSGDEGGW